MKTTPAPKTVRPQDDFYSYVNGAWLKSHPIPPTESRWGVFLTLRERSWKHLRTIYEELQSRDYPVGSLEQQARDLYYTSMHRDKFAVEHRNLLQEELAAIAAVCDRTSLAACIGRLQRMGVNASWSIYVDADDKDSTKHMFRLHQRVLTLPGREYYLESSKKMQAIRNSYLKHIQNVQGLFDELSGSDSLAQTILEIERSLAEHSRTKADLRDPETNYNKTTWEALLANYKHIDWSAYAEALRWKPDDQISVDQPEFLAFVDKQLDALPLATWKMYLQWKLLTNYFSLVSEKTSALQFEFFGKILSGTKEPMPLWKRSTLLLEGLVGPGVGRLYAERHFPESSKQIVLGMVEEVRAAYKRRIDKLDWMQPATKAEAQKKLANIKVLIGYPDEWRNYSNLTIGRDSLIANAMAAEQHESDYYMHKLHQPISRDDWYMNPQTVNAYNDPNRLVICFPAAILQPPFFDPKASVAANFGGIGSVIGHELTHGFDDNGYLFDDRGNLRAWQTEAERKAFDKKAKIIADQADHFEVLPGLCLNGKLVLGESIADLGGIELSFDALVARPGGEKLTKRQKQTFFVTYAKSECEATREEKLREFTLTDAHPAGEFRINGILAHVDAFYDAYGIRPGDKLYRDPALRARIW